jgi:hypothetical protein
MSISAVEYSSATAHRVTVDDTAICVELTDGRTITAPIAWYPRLSYATPQERQNWRFIGEGRGIHWPELDEDISVENLLLGKRSGESQPSFTRWLSQRAGNSPG